MSIQRINNKSTTPSLWELGNEYQSLLSQHYDPETGEVNMEVDAQLIKLSGSAENKCLAIAKWIKNLELEKSQIEFMKSQILEREKAYEKEISKRFDNLQRDMERCGISEIKSPYFTLKIKTNQPSTEIINESSIPEKFMREREVVKTEIKPDKNAIKEEVLASGVQVPGAYVGRKKVLQILIDKI